MIELLKEQCYHSNMVSSLATGPLLDYSYHGDVETSPGSSPIAMATGIQELPMATSIDSSVAMETRMTSHDSIMTQLSLLQQQLTSQQTQQSQQLKSTINEVRSQGQFTAFIYKAKIY